MTLSLADLLLGASTVVSSAVTSARTAGADTILRLLEDTDDEDDDQVRIEN